MNFGQLAETISNVANDGGQWRDLPLASGSRDGIWNEIKNLRLEVDGEYLLWKPRGGSETKHTFTGQIRTVYAFTASFGGTQTDYVAVHTAIGTAFLFEVAELDEPDPTSTTLFDGEFTTTSQVSFINLGKLLFIFDTDLKKYKVWDIENAEGYNWMANQSSSIESWSWIDQVDWTEKNVWGFEEGRDIIVLHNYLDGVYIDPQTQQGSYRAFRTRIDSLTPTLIEYSDPSGAVKNSLTSDQIGITSGSADLEELEGSRGQFRASDDLLKGSFEVIVSANTTTKFILDVAGVRVPESGTLEALDSDTLTDIAETIETALLAHKEVTAIWDVSRSGARVNLSRKGEAGIQLGLNFEVSIFSDQQLFINATNPRQNHTPISNDDYNEPFIYRGYLVVDLLSDGSYALGGRPVIVQTTPVEAMANRYGRIELTLPPVSTGVDKRLLFATRWQTSQDHVFTPSDERYANGAFFFAKELDPAQTTVMDDTPDRLLLAPLGGYLSMNGGISDMFGHEQIEPATVTGYQNTLIIGGYKINRPVPVPYNDAPNVGQGNLYSDFTAGTALTDSPELSVLFEYTDGRKSNIVDTGEVLTDAEIEIVTGVDGAAAVAEPWAPINEPEFSGFAEVTYPAFEPDAVSFFVDYDGSDTLEQVVTKVRDAINNDNDIQITASNNTTTELKFTEKREGDEYNGNIVMIDYQPDTTTEEIEMEGGVTGTPSVTVSGNQLQLHSLNALVSKVFLLAKFAGSPDTYKSIEEINSFDPEFHGKRIFLPNTDAGITELDAYTPPAAGDIQEAVNQHDWIIPAIPFSQPLISEQVKIKDNSVIRSVVPTQFDTDKSTMRFRLSIFTDKNLQVGYLATGENQIQKDFEIIGEGVILQHRYGAHYLRGEIIYQTVDGIYVYRPDGGGKKLLDRRFFPVLQKDLQTVIYNKKYEEYWFIFYDSTVIVCHPDGSGIKEFTYPSGFGPVRHGAFLKDKILIGIGTDLLYTDRESLFADDVEAIPCLATSQHLGDETSKLALHEMLVYGQNATVSVDLDLQTARKETSVGDWSKDFTGDLSYGGKELKMFGQNYQINRHAPMPRLRLRFDAEDGSFINTVKLKSTPTPNVGKARS